jgi:dTMP kinase
MNFVVIEGLDGSGKSTQIKLLRDFLSQKKINYKYLHFPRTDAPVYGELIARFLRGDLGDIQSVDPYLVALLYAGDRNDAGNLIRQWLDEGYFVLLDRYVNSNIAFQCAKLKDEGEQEKLKEWIIQLEYAIHEIPVPDLNIFLNVPFVFTEQQLLSERAGSERNYLNGKTDIHEADLDFQKRVREIYLSLTDSAGGKYRILDCSSEKDKILSPDEIFHKIIELIF